MPGLDPLTILSVGLIVVFGIVALFGGVETFPWPFVQFGLSWDGLSQGRLWQLVTYAFLHGGWWHLGLNLLMLWLVGGRVAHILGWRRWGEIVVAGIVVGGGLHSLTGVFLIRAGHQESYLVGVSGACIALLVALTTLSPGVKMWPVPVSGKSLGLGLMIAELCLWMMQPELGVPGLSRMGGVMAGVGGMELFQVSHACHFGGAVCGWWYARSLLNSPPSLENLQKERARREALGAPFQE